jgi:GNAT superfamily N-acetyltransferase
MSYVVETVPWEDVDAVALREAMTRELGTIYAGAGGGPPKGSAVDASTVVSTVVARLDGVPVGHAALRRVGEHLEIKRFFVVPEHRGKGVSEMLIDALEAEARALGAVRLVLHTGHRQTHAMRMYERFGYSPTGRFPPYEASDFSYFYAKPLRGN